MNGDDVRVVHRRGDARFLEETGAEEVVVGELGCQYLQRDDVAEPRVLGLVDGAHAATAENRPQPVAGELVADHGQLEHNQLPIRDRCSVRESWTAARSPSTLCNYLTTI